MSRSTFNIVTRRSVLAGTAAVGATAALAACGGGGDDSSSGSSAATTGAATTGAATPSATSSADGGGSSDALTSTSDIPVGGGKIFSSQKVVVTQPSSGTFKAYSATCTHQGCLVTSVSDGEIVCPCHNSHFSVADGSVSSGPAPSALPAVTITVSNDQITLG